MRKITILAGWMALWATILVAAPASAAFHLWKIDEVFSNTDGSVQFIELTSAFDFQNIVGGQQLKSTSNTLTLPAAPGGNLPSSTTTNHHMLFATAGFGLLVGGVTPDYIIPAHFFKSAGDTLNWAGPLNDTEMFGAVPTDGVHSLLIPGTSTASNSPTNFAGTSGSVNVPPPPTPTGDYNHNNVVDAADYTVWRDTLGQHVTAGTAADGDKSGTIDTGDYTFWVGNFGTILPGSGSGAGSAGAVPEPSTIVLAFIALAVISLALLRHRWQIAFVA